MAASPADKKLIIAASDDGVFRSEDQGESWKPVEGVKNIHSPSHVMFDRARPSRVWLCISHGDDKRMRGLFRSDDTGRTFTRLSEKSPSEMVQDPANPDLLYGLMGQRPVSSDDAGSTCPSSTI